MKRWIYAGTFDPITFGHESIIQRAAALCDELYVAVAQQPRKQTLLNGEKRFALVQQRLNALHLPQVKTLGFDGLLIDLAKNLQANALVRGLRNGADFDYERNLAHINAQLKPDLETIFLLAPPHESLISSSNVRELWRLGADIRPWVGTEIQSALDELV